MTAFRAVARFGLCPLAALAMTAGLALAHPEGNRDFTGMWLGSDSIGGKSLTGKYKSTSWPKPAPLTEAGEKAYKAYDPKTDDPPERCMPWGMPRGDVFNFYPMQLTMTDNELLMTLEYEPIPRRIYFDGRDYPDDIPPQWFGYSIGHWEGNTLVVETRNIRDDNIVTTDGLPQSDKMRVIERFTMLDNRQILKVDVTAIDPVYYTKPMHITVYWKRADDIEQHEFICAEGLIENITTSKEQQKEVLGK